AIKNHLQRFDRHCLEMTISLRDVYLDDAKDVRAEMDQTWRRYEGMWTRIIAAGQASGEFAHCGDPKMIAFAILGMCNWLARWYDPGKSTSVEELIETYFEIIANGVVKSSATGRERKAGVGESNLLAAIRPASRNTGGPRGRSAGALARRRGAGAS